MKATLAASQTKKVITSIRLQVKEYFSNHHLHYAIFGKSEGLDSSVIAGLLADIPGIKPIGVVIPIESNPEAAKIGEKVLKHFDIPMIKIDLTREYHQLAASFYMSDSINDQLINIFSRHKDKYAITKLVQKKARALGNIKCRMRMITLYHIAQLTSGIVISTDNYSEYWMGFWTLNGDVGDFAPIQQIFKGLELYTIAEALGVPKEAIDIVPTDGLDITPGGVDQDQLKLPYKKLDLVIIELLKNKFNETGDFSVVKAVSKNTKIPSELVEHVARLMNNSAFKRHVPIRVLREDIGLHSLSK